MQCKSRGHTETEACKHKACKTAYRLCNNLVPFAEADEAGRVGSWHPRMILDLIDVWHDLCAGACEAVNARRAVVADADAAGFLRGIELLQPRTCRRRHAARAGRAAAQSLRMADPADRGRSGSRSQSWRHRLSLRQCSRGPWSAERRWTDSPLPAPRRPPPFGCRLRSAAQKRQAHTTIRTVRRS